MSTNMAMASRRVYLLIFRRSMDSTVTYHRNCGVRSGSYKPQLRIRHTSKSRMIDRCGNSVQGLHERKNTRLWQWVKLPGMRRVSPRSSGLIPCSRVGFDHRSWNLFPLLPSVFQSRYEPRTIARALHLGECLVELPALGVKCQVYPLT